LDELKNIVKQRIDICNPIWVKYQLNTTYTTAFSKRIANKPNDVADDANVIFDVSMEWAQKGDRLRFVCTSPGIFNGKIVEQPKEDIYVFDGKLVINNNSAFYLNDPRYPLYSVSSDKMKAKAYESLSDLSGDTVLYRILSTFNPQKQRYELKKQGSIDNSSLGLIYLYIENIDQSEKLFVWLTDDQYRTINKLEFVSGRAKYTHDEVIYKIVNGYPILNSCKTSMFFDGKLNEEKILNVSFMELKGNKIPNSLFTIKIPKDAVVQNMDTGTSFVDTSIIKGYLDSIPLWKRPSFWLLGCVNLILIGIIIYSCRNNIKLLFTKKS
jgi:hypothetical protein